VINKETIEFDAAIGFLKKEHLFSEYIFSLVYEFYTERGFLDLAYMYVENAVEYFKKIDGNTPDFMNEAIEASDKYSLPRKKSQFNDIIATSYEKIPKITPENINNKSNINDFILEEIIQALQQMFIKIQTIRELTREDNYNDILESIFKLRFPFYGWSVQNNPHHGTSTRGKGPGEPDIVISSSSKTITIIEAIILEGKNSNRTQEHITKCFAYSNNLERYYIVIYYRGEKRNFIKTWESYTEDFNTIKFSDETKPIKQNDSFIILNSEFDNTRNFIIARTDHVGGFSMFHIMVNFSIADTQEPLNETNP
jgi:hypothetical protein